MPKILSNLNDKESGGGGGGGGWLSHKIWRYAVVYLALPFLSGICLGLGELTANTLNLHFQLFPIGLKYHQ